jgi:DNA-binding LacI/PurR family transcriptional regulator
MAWKSCAAAKNSDHQSYTMASPLRPIPFSLDRTCGTSLSEQLAAGLRDAIHIGYYRSGAVLPSKEAVAAELGVSEIVARTAYRKLVAEGLVVSRPRIGTVVLPVKSTVWRGRILCVMTDHDFNFPLNSVVEILRSRLTYEGFLFSQVQILYDRAGNPDYTAFDYSIKRSVDFVILAFGDETIERRLSESGVPYAVFSGAWRGLKGCVGCLQFYKKGAISDFVKHCISSGVKNVTVACCNRETVFCDMLAAALADAGIAANMVSVHSDNHSRRLENVAKSGAAFAREAFSCARDELPDAVFVIDDYLATGILAEIVAMGLRIPEDIRVACCITEGNRPYSRMSLAGISVDPEAAGSRFADALLDHLKHHKPFANIVIDVPYVRGESFP